MDFWESLRGLDNQMEVVERQLRNEPPSVKKYLYGIGFSIIRFGDRRLRSVVFCLYMFICVPLIVAVLYWLAASTNTSDQAVVWAGRLVKPGEPMYAYRDWLVTIGRTLIWFAWFYTLVTMSVAYTAFDITLRSVQKATGYLGEYIKPATVEAILKKIKSIIAWACAVYFLFGVMPYHRAPPLYIPFTMLLLGTAAWFRMGWIDAPPVWAQWSFNKMVTLTAVSMVFGLVLMGVFPAAYDEYQGHECEMVVNKAGKMVKKDPDCEETKGALDSMAYWVRALGVFLRHMVLEGADWMSEEAGEAVQSRPKQTKPRYTDPADSAAQSEDERLGELLKRYE